MVQSAHQCLRLLWPLQEAERATLPQDAQSELVGYAPDISEPLPNIVGDLGVITISSQRSRVSDKGRRLESLIRRMNNHRRIPARFRSRLGSFGWKLLAGSLVSVIGMANPVTRKRAPAFGAIASLPISKHHFIKFGYNDDTYTRYGNTFQNVSVAWQYSWLAGQDRRSVESLEQIVEEMAKGISVSAGTATATASLLRLHCLSLLLAAPIFRRCSEISGCWRAARRLQSHYLLISIVAKNRAPESAQCSFWAGSELCRCCFRVRSKS